MQIAAIQPNLSKSVLSQFLGTIAICLGTIFVFFFFKLLLLRHQYILLPPKLSLANGLSSHFYTFMFIMLKYIKALMCFDNVYIPSIILSFLVASKGPKHNIQ